MFNFVREPAQPIGDHPLWPCPLRVVSHFAYIHTYIYITCLDFPCNLTFHWILLFQFQASSDSIQGIRTTSVRFINGGLPGH